MKTTTLLALLCLILASTGCATRLAGTIENNIYTSGRQEFSIPVPVDLSSGGDGRVGDDEVGVTFTCLFDARTSVYCYPHADAPASDPGGDEMYEYLVGWFPGGKVLNRSFHGETQSGTTVVIVSSPDGSVTLGVAGFWAPGRAMAVQKNIGSAALFLGDNMTEKNRQIDVLTKNLLRTVQSITVHRDRIEANNDLQLTK